MYARGSEGGRGGGGGDKRGVALIVVLVMYTQERIRMGD